MLIIHLWRHNYTNFNRFLEKSGQIRGTFETLISREKKSIEPNLFYQMIDIV